jgi:hypothetical protein
MQSKSPNSKGFGHIGILVVIAVLLVVVGAGVYIHRQSNIKKAASASTQSSSTKSNKDTTTKSVPDPYEGWKTATLTAPQLSFRYPSGWTVKTAAGGNNIEVTSPTSNDHYFAVSLISGKSQDVNLNFLGKGPGTELESFTVDSQLLHLVAQTAGSNGSVTGLGLATSPGSADTSFGIIDPQKSNNVTMVASLTPVSPTSSDDGSEYSMQTYTSHASYQTVLKVFQSLSGNLPK